MAEETQLDRIENSVKKMAFVLFGNGKTGLCAKVNILWGGSVFVIGAVVVVIIKAFIF